MCYRVLGSVHNLYKPRPGRFKGLHRHSEGQRLPVAAHGAVRAAGGSRSRCRSVATKCTRSPSPGSPPTSCTRMENARASVAHRRARNWMREILEMQKAAGDPVEFIEHVKVDLFPDTVFVFTPARRDQGARTRLHAGRFRIRGSYGHRETPARRRASTGGRRRSARRSPRGRRWRSSPSRKARPDPTWINFVVTGKGAGQYPKLSQAAPPRRGDRSRAPAPRPGPPEGGPHAPEAAQGARMGDPRRVQPRQPGGPVRGHRARAAGRRAGREAPRREHPESGVGRAGSRGRSPAQRPGRGPHPHLHRGHRGHWWSTSESAAGPFPAIPSSASSAPGAASSCMPGGCGNIPDLDAKHECIDVDWAPTVEREFPVDVRVEVENRKGVLATVAAAHFGTRRQHRRGGHRRPGTESTPNSRSRSR